MISQSKKTNPIQTQSNPILSAVGGLQMNVNLYVIEDYENESTFRVRETNPNKLEANLSLRERRSLRVSFSESSNRGPIQTQWALEANIIQPVLIFNFN